MRPLVVPLLAVLAAGSPAAAQPDRSGTSPGAGEPVTEAEFLAPFVEGSPAFLALSGEPGARRADLAAARLLDDPTVGVSREEVDDEATETELTVGWRPPRPDRRRLGIEAAGADLAAAEAARAAGLVRLRADLRAAYAAWAVASVRAEPLERELDLLRELARRAGERADAGEGSGLEHRRLRLAAAEAAARTAAARAELAAAEAGARSWRPDLPPESVPVLPPLPPAGEGAPPATRGTHPRLAALEEAARAAELRERLAGKYLELPELVAGWKWVDPVTPRGAAGGSTGGPVIGLAWSLPLSDRGEPERLRAASERQALEARLDLERRRLAAEEEGALAAYEGLRRAALEADEVLFAAEPAVEAATLAFRLGEADLTTLLETVRSATAARLAALEIHAEALAAGRELDRLRASTDSSTDHWTQGDAP